MNFLEAFRIAWIALLSHKLRSLLTMLGIIIGVGAVVGMLSIGNGYSNYIQREFTKLGVGVFYITPAVDNRETDTVLKPQLTDTDALALTEPGIAPLIESITIEYAGRSGIVNAGGERYFFSVTGVTPSFFTISPNDLGSGRFFTADEERNRLRVAVIGNKVATTLFGDIYSAVGRRMIINGVSFEVVGVTVTKANQLAGAFGQFGGPEEHVYVPYQTAISRLFRNEVSLQVNVSRITVRVNDSNQINAAIDQVTTVLRDRHRLTYQNNDFTIINPEQLAQQFSAVSIGFSAFLGVIGGISLLVGGIGIMNIMLVSVTQRTREIGLRKAVGARRRDIMWQFLIESIVLCLFGALLGVGLGYLLSFGGNVVLALMFQDDSAKASVSFGTIFLATSIAAAIGVGFGLFPAMRAARLDPIQALRNE